MGVIMEEKCSIKLVKIEPEEVIIIDDLSQEMQAVFKQEPDDIGHVIEVNPQLQTEFKSFIKQETLKTELKSEEIHIISDEYEGEEIKVTPYSCNICGHKAGCGEALRIHRSHHLKEKQYKCNECDYSTNLKDIFRNHLLNHEEPLRRMKIREKPFKCKKCSFSSDKKGVLKRHVILTHCDKRLLECLTCGYETPSKGHLRQHVLIHFPNRIKSFSCDACKSRFLHEGSLLRHMSVRPCKPGHS